MKKFSQVLSVAISAAIAVTSAPWQAYALETAAVPEFVKTFTPPARLGYVVNSFQGKSKQPVILIQDLHANFGVQSKIVSLLKMFQTNIAGSGAMVVGAEGDSGPIDVSYLHKQTPKVRELASTALMKEAEIGAPMHFAATSEKNVNLVGIENMDDYKLHLALVRASVQARLKLANKIQETRAKFALVKSNMAPASLIKIWKAEDEYINGDIDLDRLAKVLHLPAINSYDEVEQVLLNRKVELARESKTNAVFLENLVRADHYLSLLGRLFRQQMTLEEVQFTARHMDEALSVLMTVLPDENWSEWQETIRSAIDYYAIALMRDKPLAENAMKLVDQNPGQPVFIVAGGFHTAGMEKALAAQNISFVSIAPVVESQTLKDEVLYLNRILGIRANIDQIKTDVQTKPWVNFVVETHDPAGKAPGSLTAGAVKAASSVTKEPVVDPIDPNAPKAPKSEPEIQTPFDVSAVELPADISGDAAMLADLNKAFTAARGFAPGSPAAAVEFGDTTAGQQQWIMNVVQRDGHPVVVVNRRVVTMIQRIRATQGEERAQQALLALALSETAVVATSSVNERTAMAARLGLFGMMGDAAAQAFNDLATVGAGEMATAFAKGVSQFIQAGGQERTAHYGTVTKIANALIDRAAELYGNHEAFKGVINDSVVRGLFTQMHGLVGTAAHNLAQNVQMHVSGVLVRVGATPNQQALTSTEVAAIYATNA